MRNQTSDLWIPRSDALPLSHGASVVSKAIYEVHNYILLILHTASISNVYSVMFCNQNKRDGKF